MLSDMDQVLINANVSNQLFWNTWNTTEFAESKTHRTLGLFYSDA